ncbi:helix-turn-helix domain-containing protein [Pseudomonas fragi]|nr:helix-turn-helix domain-containing protein [Pseudomonas fragi]WOL29954.1 helix-turn-helix domain-containing protein [Pseudomonas fragi]
MECGVHGADTLNRYEAHGQSGLQEKSRKPATSPKLTSAVLEAQVLVLRQEHPAWGGRTISTLLKKQIAPSTVTINGRAAT